MDVAEACERRKDAQKSAINWLNSALNRSLRVDLDAPLRRSSFYDGDCTACPRLTVWKDADDAGWARRLRIRCKVIVISKPSGVMRRMNAEQNPTA